MKLIEIGFHPLEGVEPPLHRAVHVYDALRRELAARDVEAPFRKLAIALTTSTTSAWCWGQPVESVVEVTGRIDEGTLTASYAVMKRGLLEAVSRAVSLASTTLGWNGDTVLAIIGELGARERVHHYELKRLAKLHRRSGRRARIFFSLTDSDGAVVVHVEREGRPLAEVTVARTDAPLPIELWWPVTKSGFEGDDFVLRNAKGDEIGRVNVTAV